MDIVHHIGGNIHRALETKGHFRAVDIVIDGFWQGDHVHAGVHEQLGALLGAVASHYHHAVQVQPGIGVQHGGHHIVALRIQNGLAGDIFLPGRSQQRASNAKDAGKILGLHKAVIAFRQAPVSVVHAEDLNIFHILGQCLPHAPNGCIQALAIPAAGEDGYASLSLHKWTASLSACFIKAGQYIPAMMLF